MIIESAGCARHWPLHILCGHSLLCEESVRLVLDHCLPVAGAGWCHVLMSELVDQDAELWIFGYGSLIWRPAFEHDRRQAAGLAGYERRFCQASHDHRGTPALPGRVVTLLPVPGSVCRGMAYKLPDRGRGEILEYLDHREQDGYERLYAPLHMEGGMMVAGLTWVAHESNPSWRAGESLEDVARLIAERHGPSGSNREYLYELEQALNALEMPDPHVSELSQRVRQLANES